MTNLDVKATLQRLQTILQQHPGDSASWVARLVLLCEQDQTALYQALNSQRMWGGAGSIANEALADNPGIDDWSWQMAIREFRDIMIQLGLHLKSRGHEYPDISSWVMAFNHWNQSEV
jgi:hypothetical protein